MQWGSVVKWQQTKLDMKQKGDSNPSVVTPSLRERYDPPEGAIHPCIIHVKRYNPTGTMFLPSIVDGAELNRGDGTSPRILCVSGGLYFLSRSQAAQVLYKEWFQGLMGQVAAKLVHSDISAQTRGPCVWVIM